MPSDRKQEGLVLIHSLKDNVTITRLDELGRGLTLNNRKMKEYAEILDREAADQDSLAERRSWSR